MEGFDTGTIRLIKQHSRARFRIEFKTASSKFVGPVGNISCISRGQYLSEVSNWGLVFPDGQICAPFKPRIRPGRSVTNSHSCLAGDNLPLYPKYWHKIRLMLEGISPLSTVIDSASNGGRLCERDRNSLSSYFVSLSLFSIMSVAPRKIQYGRRNKIKSLSHNSRQRGICLSMG